MMLFQRQKRLALNRPRLIFAMPHPPPSSRHHQPAAISGRVDLLVIRVRLLADPVLVDDLDEDALEVDG